MSFALNVPINLVSFGQVATTWLRKLYERNACPLVFPIGGQADLSTQHLDAPFVSWLQTQINLSVESHCRKNPTLKLWHLDGSLDSFSEKQVLLSFYELDSPTQREINIGKNNTLVFSSKYTCEVFKSSGVNCHHVPLGFDHYNFKKLDKQFFTDGRVTFNLVGKLEKRKRHEKTIRAWVKKYGNNPRYFLQCAVYNHFLKPEDNQALVNNILEGKKYFNVNFLGFMQKNSTYNDFLNSGDIILATSGGEGWGLPEFHSVAVGKHAVVLNEHGYKEWANEKNSTLFNSSGKIECYDGIFFKKGESLNQGNIFDFNEDDFLSACEEAVKKVGKNRVNEEGLKLQETFTIDKTLDGLMELL